MNITNLRKVDLRDEIETHCLRCYKCDSSECSVCFFGTVNFGSPDLGNLEIYNRAFKLLRIYKRRGFRRNKPFGNYLNIGIKNETNDMP